MTAQPRGKRILIVEDDRTLNAVMAKELEGAGHAVTSAHSWSEAEHAIVQEDPGLAILDLRLPDANGLDVLPQLNAQCPVIVLTAYGSIDDAVRATKAGAVEYLTKPVTPEQLDLVVTRSLETASLQRSYEFFKNRNRAKAGRLMIGESEVFKTLLRQIELVARADSTVLILGESGVGKELVAQRIHLLSPRGDHNLVPVDCCTLQEGLFESELFGYQRGAFPGATERKRGLVEVAEGGTLFLDEIGELSLAIQAKLLRVMETGYFRRVGGTRDLDADVRFLAASNHDLASMVKSGSFRQDLYYRLAGFVIPVPTLRERREDIIPLAEHFLKSRAFARSVDKRLSEAAKQVLVECDWPGNVRELRNAIERAILVSDSNSVIMPEHLGLSRATGQSTMPVELAFDHSPTLDEISQAYISKLLKDCKGRRAQLAKILGVSERTAYRMLKKFDLH